jgi:N-acetyl-1-D-myo-inositol-2-amino-2-deoxy-alpha-D-glucopyranoside deacetylase
MNRTELRGRSLLGIFAHPDDESLACGGLMAWCADLGADVTVVCLTRGEHGPGADHDPAAHPDGLGATRVGELLGACRALGVAHVTIFDHEDGMLPWIDAWQIERDVQHIIGQVSPDVVITFDEDGLYWHPDHIAVHERTTSVVSQLGARAPALYYAQLPPDAMRAVVRHAELASVLPDGAGAMAKPRIFGISDAGAFGSQTIAPTLLVDAAAYGRHKLAALNCHATQMSGGALSFVTEDSAANLLGREQYRRATVGRQGRTFIDDLGRPA